MREQRVLRAILIVLALPLATAKAPAQTNDDINAAIQFNFSTPGARSLGLGGAFLGVADDATAAYANPAGLTNLAVGGSEVSVELRRWRYSHLFPDRGHAAGPPSGIGVDTISGVEDGTSESVVNGLSFLSVGYVLPQGWTLALYRHELANFEADVVRQGPLLGDGGNLFRINPARSALRFEVVNFGLSGAFEVKEGLSLGLGFSYFQGELASKTERFDRSERDADGDGDVDTADDRANRQPGGFFGPPDFLGDNLVNTQTQVGDDADWGFNLGVLWRIRNGFSLGATYRQGPDFQVEAAYIYGPRSEADNPRNRNGTRNPDLGGRAVLHVPDVYGLGVAWTSPADNLKLALDYDRIRYSRLTDDLTNLLLREAGSFDRSDYRVKDANEFHAGLEYVFLALGTDLVGTARFGTWYDPAHSLEFTGGDETLRARFPARDGEIHLAAGVGLVIRESFQVDTALDFSDRVSTFSVSLVKFL